MTIPRPFLFLTTLLLVAAHPVAVPEGAAPRLAVEQGAVLRKVFVTTWDMDLEGLSVTVDGEDIRAGDDLSIEQDERQRIEFVDSYREVKDGRATELVRHFETLESESTTDTTSAEESDLVEQSKTSALEGLEVVFRWDDEEAAYTAEFLGDGGDGELLEELEQDADLGGFLPEQEPDVDSTWTVGVGEVRKLLSPSGDLSFVDEDGEDDDDDGLAEQFEDNMTGEFAATYRGTREVDGREVALIELVGEFETDAELEGEDGVSGTAALTMTLEGELLWDLAGGHFRSIRLSGPCEIEFGSTMGDGQHEFEQSLTFAGTFEFEGEVTREG